jgi:hypothetical protein
MPTNREVAEWMATQVPRHYILYQEWLVGRIQRRFGKEHVYVNAGGGLSISRGVLREFRKLTPDLIWDRSEKGWRKRYSHERSGRLAD